MHNLHNSPPRPGRWLSSLGGAGAPRLLFPLVIAVSALAACAPTGVKNAPGTPTAYQDVGTSGLVRGTGIESQDIAGMTDKMVRHMLANPVLADTAVGADIGRSLDRANRGYMKRGFLGASATVSRPRFGASRQRRLAAVHG